MSTIYLWRKERICVTKILKTNKYPKQEHTTCRTLRARYAWISNRYPLDTIRNTEKMFRKKTVETFSGGVNRIAKGTRITIPSKIFCRSKLEFSTFRF
jgi:hypothetical protein